MQPLLERLKAGERLVSDGAIGTMLFERGAKPGESLDALNVDAPEMVEEVLASYVDAGADLVQTNTLGASTPSLTRHGLGDRTEEINRAAVRVAKSAARGRALVYGSCGSSGRLLKPYGDAEPEEIREGFLRQMGAMAEEGADLICIETMTDLEEAVIAVRAAKEAAPGLTVAATMTFDETPRGFFTVMGASIETSCRRLEQEGADIIGSNCGNGTEKMVRIAREFRTATALPLIIQSNAGLPVIEGGETVYPETPELFFERTGEFLAAGVAIVGGCCGSTPDHVRAIRRAVDAFKRV